MSILVTSTTDSKEAVSAANGDLAQKNEEVKSQSASVEATDEITEESDASEETEELEASQNDEESQDEDQSKEADEKPKKKGGFQKRIDKMTKRLSAKEQEAEYWKAEALKQKTADAPKKEVESIAKVEAGGKPSADDFESHEAYVEALTDWKIEQREAKKEQAQKQEQAKSAYQKQIDEHNKRVVEFQKEASDYKEVVQDFIEEHGDIKFSLALEESIISSENGPALVYELLKNKEELDRINSLHPLVAAREIGKLEARLAKASESSEKKEIKTTKAPKPLTPVGTKSSGAGKKSIFDPDLSQREYEAIRDKEERARSA
jgi:uncharacterized protein YozE (UPF0346 family)